MATGPAVSGPHLSGPKRENDGVRRAGSGRTVYTGIAWPIGLSWTVKKSTPRHSDGSPWKSWWREGTTSADQSMARARV